MPVPDSSAPQKLTTKQQREASRALKVAALKKKQANEKRNRIIGLASAATGAVAVLTLIIVLVVTNPTPTKVPTSGSDPTSDPSASITDLIEYPDLTAVHVDTPVDYEADYDMNPPAGGNHAAAWLTCGVYNQEQQNENAVHSLEHGAVWVTYNPDEVDADGVAALAAELPTTYSILSPYEGLPSPVVASAWGAQVQLDGVDDARLATFLEKYWKSPTAPEPGAACTGAYTGPGKVG